MQVFEYIYNGIIKAFDFLLNLTGVQFYACLAICLYIAVAIYNLIATFFSEEAKSLRGLKKINKLCLKQAKKPREDFYDVLNDTAKKGRSRVSNTYKNFLKTRNVSITETLQNARIYTGYSKPISFLDKAAVIIALMVFVLTLGFYKAVPMLSSEVFFLSLVVPFLILLINFIFASIVKKINSDITEDLTSYGAFVNDICFDMLEGNEDFLFAAEDKFLASPKGKKQVSKTAKLRDPSRKSSIIEQNKQKQFGIINIVKGAESSNGGRELRDFDFLEANLALVNEKEKIEEELKRAKWEVEENERDLNKDIKNNTAELAKVRQDIKETNDEEIAKNLKKQESFQVKLLDALEKLKKSQYQSYLETETKLKTELKKIDEELKGKRAEKEHEIKTEVDTFSSNLQQELNNNGRKETDNFLLTPATQINNDNFVVAENKALPLQNAGQQSLPVGVYKPLTEEVQETDNEEEAEKKTIKVNETNIKQEKADESDIIEPTVEISEEPATAKPDKPKDSILKNNEEKVTETKAITSVSLDEKKKNINNALTDLLEAMNKYQTKNKK